MKTVKKTMNKILVVDDEATITMQLEERLTAMGYEVCGTASSGEEAVELARALRPDIILMDIMMSKDGMDGIQASEKIKEELDIPVIFLTAYSDDEIVCRAKRIEPFGYILKPFETMEVRSNIEIALQKHNTEKILHATHRFLEIANGQSGLSKLLNDFIIEIGRTTGFASVAVLLLDEENQIIYQKQKGFDQEWYVSESPYSLKSNPYLYSGVIDQKPDSRPSFYTKDGSFFANQTAGFLEMLPIEMKEQAGRLYARFGFETIAFVPVRYMNRILGIIHASDVRQDMITPATLEILEKAGLLIGNIVQKIRTEEEAEARQASFDNIVEKSKDAIIVTDVHGLILFVNHAAQLQFNRNKEQLVGELFGFSVDLEKNTEIDIILQDGKITTGEMYGVETEWRGEHALLITIRDISDRKKAEQALIAANEKLKELDQLKTDFISTVSHELRTPIAIIREAVALCLDGVMGKLSENQNKFLTSAQNNIDRLARLVTDLLDVSKLEQNKMKLRRISFDIWALARKTYDEYKPQAELKKIWMELEKHFSGDSLMYFGDNDKITQILNNLIVNAIHFTKAGDRITIQLTDEKDFLKFSVTDTGIGISKENIPKLFNKFQQFGRIAGPGYKGTGLGLAISKGLVESHGGEIKVESELGQGSSFIFTLKKELFPKILIVDDNKEMVGIVAQMLAETGYRHAEAYDGEQAVQTAQREPFDLILLDMHLPIMGGYEVIGRLKQDKRTHNIPILIMSAFSVDLDDISFINNDTVIPMIKKPFSMKELTEAVQEWMIG
jgi:signal transduction histidine kinase/DNA-binding response OmpR family regulator